MATDDVSATREMFEKDETFFKVVGKTFFELIDMDRLPDIHSTDPFDEFPVGCEEQGIGGINVRIVYQRCGDVVLDEVSANGSQFRMALSFFNNVADGIEIKDDVTAALRWLIHNVGVPVEELSPDTVATLNKLEIVSDVFSPIATDASAQRVARLIADRMDRDTRKSLDVDSEHWLDGDDDGLFTTSWIDHHSFYVASSLRQYRDGRVHIFNEQIRNKMFFILFAVMHFPDIDPEVAEWRSACADRKRVDASLSVRDRKAFNDLDPREGFDAIVEDLEHLRVLKVLAA